MQSQCSGAVITLPILPISLLATSVDVCRTQCAGVSDVIRTCELREKDTARYFLFCSSPKGFHFHVQRRELPRPSVCASLALLQQTPPGCLGPTGRDATVCITGLVIHSLVREEKQLRNYQGTHISDYPATNADQQKKIVGVHAPYIKTNKGFIAQASALQLCLSHRCQLSCATLLEARYTAHHGDRDGRPTGGGHCSASLRRQVPTFTVF